MSYTPSYLMAALAIASAATGQTLVTSDIAVSTTWTANNVYSLQQQIYVLPGATLTIQAGTVVASTTDLGGSLAVARGARLIVEGTEKQPVIFTSQADRATWGGGGTNPKTGTWREECNEWGNITIMGNAYISSCLAGNTPAPNAANRALMEGLVGTGFNQQYGGGNDDDDSGSIAYLSLRYGGKVIALGNELNGLSLGGIGRETDLHHIEIMNNVDDGIEIWGGTVNLKYFSIWNIGDDSLDVDQGWRGKAQFGLVVQGFSQDAAQGSGVGDNVLEIDGAEDAAYQPITTAVVYNCTFIGQPLGGDHATAWRDNARVQFRNCIFMDIGDRIVSQESGDTCLPNIGYGFGGTLNWPTTWTTAHNVYSTVNAPSNPADFYRAQTSGNLIEIKDSVFYNNLPGGYTEATNRGVFAVANNNVREPASMPIRAITRAAAVTRGGVQQEQVTSLDPRPSADALASIDFAPNDGFFSSARYRGAFTRENSWLTGWTASDAFGFTPGGPWVDLGHSLTGTNGAPVLGGSGVTNNGSPINITLSNGAANSPSVLVIGLGRLNFPLFGGTLVPSFDLLLQLNTDGGGAASITFPYPPGVASGTSIYFQHLVFDLGAPANLSFSNAVAVTKP